MIFAVIKHKGHSDFMIYLKNLVGTFPVPEYDIHNKKKFKYQVLIHISVPMGLNFCGYLLTQLTQTGN